jgi:hypothetical protein
MKNWMGISCFGFGLVWLLIFSLFPEWGYLIHLALAIGALLAAVKYYT